MKLVDKNLRLLIFLSLIIPVITFVPIPLKYSSIIAQSELKCDEQLTLAEEKYNVGNWQEAIELIEQCLNTKDVSEIERGGAYRLLGLVYIATELEKDAIDALRNFLIMVPNYKVDPERDPPQLTEIIGNILQTLNPTITRITPNKATVDDKRFTMTVDGIDFVYGSVVQFNGEDRATNFISSSQLTAEIPSTDLVKDGEYDISVHSPVLGGKTSNMEKFIVKSSGGVPWTWIGIGAGAVAAGVVAILVLGNGDEDVPPETLADPPVRP